MNTQKIRVLKQHPIDHYIVDFYIPSVQLVIEIDGDSHHTQDGIEYDDHRTMILGSYGIKVLRFTNQDVYNNLNQVFQDIIKEYNNRKHKIERVDFVKDDITARGLICNGRHMPYNPSNIAKARELRKNMTSSEKKIWFGFLRNFQDS